MTLTKFLATEQKKEDGDGADDTIKAANSKTNRLKWIPEHTMAAQGDFERRRAVEGGALREFLLHGSLAFVAHPTLFVHGGIIDGGASLSALGRVPDEPSKHFDSITLAVLSWADILLRWACQFHFQTQLRLSCLKMEFGVPHDTCARDRSNDTVVFQDVIMCDTSCSDARAPDNRGSTASEVVVEPSGRVLVNGVLENGHCIKHKLDEGPWSVDRDGTMVKDRLANEDASGEEKSYLVFRN
ncbi:unnamed protein product [Peronospora destructor]|uniref:Uncharacterized protein n=1 Tax=Peronospora destructor TaxID=86335 RepID=A0AAV0TVT1_9STRA|nr:unnamed protein product [Peronospora destructor]